MKQRTPDPDEEQVPKNAIPKKLPAKKKSAKPQPPPQKKPTDPPPQKPTAPRKDQPFKPISVMPVTDDGVLNNLIARDIKNPFGPLDAPSPTLRVLEGLVKGFSAGTDLGPVKEDIERITGNQVEKATLLEACLRQLDQERMAGLLIMRDNAERVVRRASGRNDLSTPEALTVWRLSQDGIVDCVKNLSKAKPVDTLTVVQRVDIHQQKQDTATAERWEGTTPQGREIIRKKLHELKKRVIAAKAAAPAPK